MTIPERQPRLDIPSRYTDFALQPGYQRLTAIRKQMKALHIDDPFFRPHDGIAGATTCIEGREYINFASYNYLNFAGHPRVIAAAQQAAAQYGTSVGASRPVAGERPLHRELERGLAELHGTEDSIALVSGHATNVSTIAYLLGPGDLLLHDKYIHNSSLMGAQLSGAKRMSFAHNDLEALEALLARHRHAYKRTLIVTEGLYSMDGDIPDLPRLINLKNHYQSWLMVDEAHSIGVLGKHGRGTLEHFGLDPEDIDIWMGTLSKTLASCGGYIAGCRELTESLRCYSPGFLFSVGMTAQNAAPALQALQLMANNPDPITRLRHNSRYFLEQARQRGLDTGLADGYAVVPIIIGSTMRAIGLSHTLLNHGINVQPIMYPAVPEESARLRFFFSCEHTPKQIDYTLDALENALATC